MKKVLLFCLMGLVVVGCKSKKERIYEAQMEAVVKIFDANGQDGKKEVEKKGIGVNPQIGRAHV